MTDFIISIAENYVQSWGYLTVFLISLFENSIFLGAFVPGEVTAVLAGFYAGQGILTWPLVVILNSIGAVIGDNVGFYLGRKKGKRWLAKIGKRFDFTEEKIDAAEEFWVDFGGRAVFFARFIAFARTFIPFLAGASRLKHGKFFVYDLAGAIIHGLVMIGVGYFFGEHWENILHTFGLVGVVLFVILLVSLYQYVIKKGLTKLEEKINEDQ